MTTEMSVSAGESQGGDGGVVINATWGTLEAVAVNVGTTRRGGRGR